MPNPLPFKLWIDADALPNLLKDYLLKVSDRHLITLCFVANQPIGIRPSTRIHFRQVLQGADVADQYIVDHVQPLDIVITQDIPLAARVIEKHAVAIHPRGECYTQDNIRARLHLRDYMDALRTSGINTGGPPPMTEKEKKRFADQLEALITRHKAQSL